TLDVHGVGVDLLAGVPAAVPLGAGAAKTFELWIAFADAGHGDPGALAARLQHPLVAHVDPGWVVGSHALPNAIAPTSAGAADFLPRLERGIATYLARNRAERWDDGPPVVPCDASTADPAHVGAYGALNWGDWNFPGFRDHAKGCFDAWGNLEYD